jgi:hypothetical protein
MGEWGDREVGKFQLILQNPKTSKPQNLNYLFFYFITSLKCPCSIFQ